MTYIALIKKQLLLKEVGIGVLVTYLVLIKQ